MKLLSLCLLEQRTARIGKKKITERLRQCKKNINRTHRDIGHAEARWSQWRHRPSTTVDQAAYAKHTWQFIRSPLQLLNAIITRHIMAFHLLMQISRQQELINSALAYNLPIPHVLWKSTHNDKCLCYLINRHTDQQKNRETNGGQNRTPLEVAAVTKFLFVRCWRKQFMLKKNINKPIRWYRW